MNDTSMRIVLTVEEAAELLGIGRTLMYALVVAGEIESVRIGRLRQGEVLGLRWPDVDLDTGTLLVRRARLRPRYVHGCVGTCGRKAGFCPSRVLDRPEIDDTKSRAGRRAMGLPDELVSLLKEHREEQHRERETAGQLWRDTAYVFITPVGEPLNPNTNCHHWKRLLKTRGCGTAGCTTPGTPPRRCC